MLLVSKYQIINLDNIQLLGVCKNTKLDNNIINYKKYPYSIKFCVGNNQMLTFASFETQKQAFNVLDNIVNSYGQGDKIYKLD